MNDPVQIPLTPEVVALMTKQNADDVADLKKSHETLATSLANLVGEVKTAKWVIGLAFGFLQPVGIGVVIHYLTKG